MKGTFHIVTQFGEEWLNAEDYSRIETLDYIDTDKGVMQLVGEVRMLLYSVPVGLCLQRPPLEIRAKSVEFIPEYIIPKNVYVVYTEDWNDETTIEEVFSTKEKADAYANAQPGGDFRRYIDEYRLK
jgi:hypothetical protein